MSLLPIDQRQALLRRRLLQDIAELQAKPYPNITLHVQDADFTRACLILMPNGKGPLHLTVTFGNYPLEAPRVTIQSWVRHPNVYDDYICASILNTDNGWTAAYTIKAVALQLLSFFSSDKLEQEYGGEVDLTAYQSRADAFANYISARLPPHRCSSCNHLIDAGTGSEAPASAPLSSETGQVSAPVAHLSEETRTNLQVGASPASPDDQPRRAHMTPPVLATDRSAKQTASDALRVSKNLLGGMPDEVLLLLCNQLDTDELMLFARSWNRIGRIILQYNLIRTRELRCFCLKQDFHTLNLGIGVRVVMQGRVGMLESEFDLLSHTAFREFLIRRSVQGVQFRHWMPLPITRRHWNKVKDDVHLHLREIGVAAKIEPGTSVNVLYHFMNDVVVKLSQEASKLSQPPPRHSYEAPPDTAQSTLKHASEKAIEAYFSLWHLLLCLATAAPAVVRAANTTIHNFLSGQTDKTACPNLGHLLVAMLVSDTPHTDTLTIALIREAVTRNVVWMLDARGANRPELSYMEASATSEYRLAKTFEAGKTSYRLLMFLNLFRRTTQPACSDMKKKTLEALRDALFDAYGAPPHGAAAHLAAEIKKIQEIDSFSDFLTVMGVQNMPSKSAFTAFLRNCVEDSVKKGYSIWAISQEEALRRRRLVEPGVEVNTAPNAEWKPKRPSGTFFPGTGHGKGRSNENANARARGGRRR